MRKYNLDAFYICTRVCIVSADSVRPRQLAGDSGSPTSTPNVKDRLVVKQSWSVQDEPINHETPDYSSTQHEGTALAQHGT